VHRLLFGSTIERLLYRTELPLLIVKRSPQDQYRRLLIGTDFSDCALTAARFAAALLPGAALTVFHAAESCASCALGRLRRAGRARGGRLSVQEQSSGRPGAVRGSDTPRRCSGRAGTAPHAHRPVRDS
jgi:nucleotide-binding universal stress UspA family protein